MPSSRVVSIVVCSSVVLAVAVSIKYFFKKRPTLTEVIHIDDDFIILNKQADLKINSNTNREETVQTFLKKKFPELANPKLYHEYYFPHRLDYATSGILCIPKTKAACQSLSQALYYRNAQKYYIALVRGRFSKIIVDVQFPIGADTRSRANEKMCTGGDYCENPVEARTMITVLEEGLYDGYPATKILCRTFTGRRHQIRAHCSSLGHTIIGDFTYSNKKDNSPSRMYLHAIRLVVPSHFVVSLDDPFVKAESWKTTRIIQSLFEGFNKIDSAASC